MSQFQVEKRFGYIAVNKGYISEKQLAEAMVLQINENLCGMEHRLVGQILLSLGYMTQNQIDNVLIAMHFPLVFLRQLYRHASLQVIRGKIRENHFA